MKPLHISLLAAVSLLVSCDRQQRLDGSSEEKFKASIDLAKKDLSSEQREAFEKAAMFLTFHDKNLLEISADPEASKRTMRDRLNGKTASEVIKEAEQIRSGRTPIIASQVKSEISELEGKKKTSNLAAKELALFEVERSRFYYEEKYSSMYPRIELTVKNGMSSAVSRAYFEAVLETPGRSVPWIKERFNYMIPGGLEPGESATWHLEPNMFSDWGKVPQDRSDMVLTCTVVRLDGPDGAALHEVTFSDNDEKRLEELRKHK